MSMTTYEMARIWEQLDESPEKVMFGKLLAELGNQSSERVRSAAKQVPLPVLRDLVFQFQQVIDSRKTSKWICWLKNSPNKVSLQTSC